MSFPSLAGHKTAYGSTAVSTIRTKESAFEELRVFERTATACSCALTSSSFFGRLGR